MKEINYESSTKTIINKINSDLRANAVGFLLCACSIGLMKLIFGMVCPMRIFIGLPCPGCGLTRAFILLLKGDIAGSIRMHPLLLPVMAGVFLYLYQRYSLASYNKAIQLYCVFCIVAVFMVYISRMIFVFPYSPPMLYESQNMVHFLTEIMEMYGI